MRIIDADALLDRLEMLRRNYTLKAGYRDAMTDAIGEVRDALTIDAVPVVRCKDCNHCDPENYHCDHYMGTVAPLSRKPDDFCSYGERKDDETD